MNPGKETDFRVAAWRMRIAAQHYNIALCERLLFERILLMGYDLGKEWAVIPKQKDFLVTGLNDAQITYGLRWLELYNLLECRDGNYRIRPPAEWVTLGACPEFTFKSGKRREVPEKVRIKTPLKQWFEESQCQAVKDKEEWLAQINPTRQRDLFAREQTLNDAASAVFAESSGQAPFVESTNETGGSCPQGIAPPDARLVESTNGASQPVLAEKAGFVESTNETASASVCLSVSSSRSETDAEKEPKPSLPEVLNYAQSISFHPELAREWFDEMQTKDWRIMNKGKVEPVRNWRAVLKNKKKLLTQDETNTSFGEARNRNRPNARNAGIPADSDEAGRAIADHLRKREPSVSDGMAT